MEWFNHLPFWLCLCYLPLCAVRVCCTDCHVLHWWSVGVCMPRLCIYACSLCIKGLCCCAVANRLPLTHDALVLAFPICIWRCVSRFNVRGACGVGVVGAARWRWCICNKLKCLLHSPIHQGVARAASHFRQGGWVFSSRSSSTLLSVSRHTASHAVVLIAFQLMRKLVAVL